MKMTKQDELAAKANGMYLHAKAALGELAAACKAGAEYMDDKRFDAISYHSENFSECWRLYKEAEAERERGIRR